MSRPVSTQQSRPVSRYSGDLVPALSHQQVAPLFKDFQEQLSLLHGDVEELKRLITTSDEALVEDIKDVEREIENERFERRESVSTIQPDQRLSVHRDCEKIAEEVEDVSKIRLLKERESVRQVDAVVREFALVKASCSVLCGTWATVATKLSTPGG
eukprot:TRINITY_DN23657_c0_g1_i1.p1 TRINITY_DN23657_c0_g1~~TRINITY_DN23657_c0_g1_i1.p1  ORF type:complete len:168 (+),score=36.86 TRINITY_DN23657_c0_g1_i1:36-506(+)